MRHAATIFLTILLLAPYGTGIAQDASHATSSKLDGTSMATAVLIDEADDDAAIQAENAWLNQHYPAHRKVGQALLRNKGRYYDTIDIITTSNAQVKTYFDITKSQQALTNLFSNPK